MKIETLSLDFSREKNRVRRRFQNRLDTPLFGDFPPLMELLRSSRAGPVAFRVNDAPDVLIEWHRFGRTSAVTYLVESGVARLATLQLTGLMHRNDNAAISHLAAIVPAFGKWVSESTIKPERPLLGMVSLGETDDDDIAPIIPLICLMPALCELAGLA
jgi:hypothetical protein